MANLTGANLTGAALAKANLAGANLTEANLSYASLVGADIAFTVTKAVIWHDTVCPNGSTSSTSCGPGLVTGSLGNGLLASDWLTVNSETGDTKFLVSNGDEPILLTANLTTTLGYAGSSSSNLVDYRPNEIKSGVDAGQRVDIPNETGDNFLNYWEEKDADSNFSRGFRQLGTDDIFKSATRRVPVPVPVVITVTMALEGDMSAPSLVGELGTLLFVRQLYALGGELEAAKIYVGTTVKRVDIPEGGSGYTTAPTVTFIEGFASQDAEGIATVADGKVTGVQITNAGKDYIAAPAVQFTGGGGTGAKGVVVLEKPTDEAVGSVLGEALKRIEKTLAPKWYEYVALALKRIDDWALSVGDPDDPVGLGVTVLIPVDSTVRFLIELEGGPTKLCDKKGQCLDSNYTRLLDGDENQKGRQDFDIRTALWDTNVQVRVGLLVPSEAGKPGQQWSTNYAGDYLDNQWANWTVETEAWAEGQPRPPAPTTDSG
jgi:hypothetical protein